MMNGKIVKMLEEYKALKRISFSMPGHKNGRGMDFGWGAADVTELPDTDSLHYSDGAVKNACEKISEIYSVDRSYIMVNGSTGGIFTMLASVCKRGDKILVSRLCHMSVVNACVILGLCPVFFNHKMYEEYSIFGEADIEDLKRKADKNIKAVLITSPNYYGIVSDIKAIKEVLKEKSIPLLVDEAHGAHFFAGRNFPENALELGADMVVQSVHKTLNGLNQSALLHIKSEIIDKERVEEMLGIFQTSSPSYPIAASAESAVIEVKEDNSRWEYTYKRCVEIKNRLRENSDIKIPDMQDGFYALDETRLVFNFSDYDISGYEVSEFLKEKWNIDIEMADNENIVLIATASNTESDFDELENALGELVKNLKKTYRKNKMIKLPEIDNMEVNPAEAYYAESELKELRECVNRISAKTVTVYPPGVPVLVPGGKIDRECIEYLGKCGGEITGMKAGKIRVIKEGES